MYFSVGSKSELPKGLFDRLLRYRFRVFIEHLGWELPAKNNLELDQFDREDTVYVIALDDEEIIGCARLLPTLKPYLLGEVFPQLLNGLAPPCSPTIWEMSRFAAMRFSEKKMEAGRGYSSACTIELTRESIRYITSVGAKQLVTVSPLGIERIISRAGFVYHRMGPPILVDGRPVVSCLIEGSLNDEHDFISTDVKRAPNDMPREMTNNKMVL